MKKLKEKVRQRLMGVSSGFVVGPLRYQRKAAFESQGLQKLLAYRFAERAGPACFDEAGFGVYSEFGEDGILLYLFSILGHGQRRLVEIGCGAGSQNNSANLIVHHYWNGLLIDADAGNCSNAEKFFGQVPAVKLHRPTILNEFVDPENVNQLVKSWNGAPVGELDLLSLDIDSIDLWVLQALSVVRPRVIVLEINSRWGPGESMTVPKDGRGAPIFRDDLGMVFAGASLDAFVKLLTPQGYRLVGSNHVATNVFFVLDALCDERLPAVTIESILNRERAVNIRRQCKEVMCEYPWESF